MPTIQAMKWAASPPASPRMTLSNGGTPARSERTVTRTRPSSPARPRQRRMLTRARGCAMTDGVSTGSPPPLRCLVFFALAMSAPAHPQLGALLLGDEPVQAVLVEPGDVVDADALLVSLLAHDPAGEHDRRLGGLELELDAHLRPHR